jgi:hypothetical protein
MATSLLNRKKLVGLYLAIEDVKENGFSPIYYCKDEITDTFADLRDNFRSVLTASQLNALNKAESILGDYYDNFGSNSDEVSDELLDKVSKLLDSVAPHLTEEQADKWL